MKISAPFLVLLTLFCLGELAAKPSLPPRAEPQTLSARHAKMIVVGKVSSVEKDVTEAKPPVWLGTDAKTLSYRVATVKISELILGPKGLSEVRIGFYVGGGDAFTPRVINPLGLRPLEEGNEGCFILEPQGAGDFYVYSGQPSNGIISIKDPNYETELKLIRKTAQALKDPVTMLKSKEKEDRIFGLTVVASNYRALRTTGPRDHIELSKEENDLLLDTLLETPAKLDSVGIQGKRDLFYLLLGERIGELGYVLQPVKPGDDAAKIENDAINEFIKANRSKITIKKLVPKK